MLNLFASPGWLFIGTTLPIARVAAPLPVVSERLGHSSVRVAADVYSHAIHGKDDEAANKWEEFLRRNGGSDAKNRKVV